MSDSSEDGQAAHGGSEEKYVALNEMDHVEAHLVRHAIGVFKDDYDPRFASTILHELPKDTHISGRFNRRGTEFLSVVTGKIKVNGKMASQGSVFRIDPGEIIDLHVTEGSQLASHIFPFVKPLTHIDFEKYNPNNIRDFSNVLVSIVIIAKDIEHYICQCITSCLTQTYCNLQIIVVDDGSSDTTFDKARSMATFDSRLEVHFQPIGRNGVRRFGVATARGEYCLIIDGDDWINMDAIEKLVSTAAEAKSDCVMFGYDYHSDRNRTVWDPIYPAKSQVNIPNLYDTRDESSAIEIAEHNHTIWMYFFGSSLYQNVIDSLIDLYLYEDLPFYISLIRNAKNSVKCNFILYHYRRDRLGQTTSNWDGVPAALKMACLEAAVDSIISERGDNTGWFHLAILYYKIRRIVDFEWTLEHGRAQFAACAAWERMSTTLAQKLPRDLAARITSPHPHAKFVEAHSSVSLVHSEPASVLETMGDR